MTKKDYQAIAGALYRTYARVAEPAEPSPEQTVGFAVDAIADVLAADNPRFSRETFVLACEDGNVGRRPKRTPHVFPIYTERTE